MDDAVVPPGKSVMFTHTNFDGDAVAGNKFVQITRPAVTPPGQLPRDDPYFRGRRGVLDRLDGLLVEAKPTGIPLVIVIQGMPGVGKTALAVHWAHRIVGGFPHGQLFVNLRGHSSRAAMTPAEALDRTLRALGQPGEMIPSEVDEQMSLYRSCVADRKLLVVLDNAASSDQVFPLLPAGRDCVTITTSRKRLAGLVASSGVRIIDLGVLRPEEALDLVAAIVGEEQTRAEAEAAAEMVSQCAYLPLALRIAAANLKVRRHDTIADTTRELAEGDRLSVLALDEDSQESAVRTAFGLSYRDLVPEVQRAFRLLGLIEGVDFGEVTVAALLGVPVEDGQWILRRLSQANLVEQVSQHRYRLHDLLRDYSRDRLQSEEQPHDRLAAVLRLTGSLLAAARSAALFINPHRRVMPIDGFYAPMFASLRDALAWFEEEQGTLIATVRQAFGLGLHTITWQLADAAFDFLDLRAYTQQNLEVHRLAHKAAEIDEAPYVKAITLRHMAIIHRALYHYGTAITVGDEACRIFRQQGDRWGEAEALATLASVYWHRGQYDRFRALVNEALGIRREIGDRMGEADCLNDLARLSRRLESCQDAIGHALAALDLRQELGDRRGEARTFHNLSRIYCRMGLHRRALADAQSAEMIYRELGDQGGQASALCSIANIHRHMGRNEHALGPAEEALRLQLEIGDIRGESISRENLARVYAAKGCPSDALRHAHLALDISERHDDPYGRALRLHTLGLINTRLGRLDEAYANFEVERAIRAGLNDERGQATTLIALADLFYAMGRMGEAIEHAEQSVAIERQFGNPFAIGRRLHAAGNIISRVRGTSAGRPYWEEAAKLLYDFDRDEVEQLVRLLGPNAGAA